MIIKNRVILQVELVLVVKAFMEVVLKMKPLKSNMIIKVFYQWLMLVKIQMDLSFLLLLYEF